MGAKKNSEKNNVWKNLTLRDFFKKKIFFRLSIITMYYYLLLLLLLTTTTTYYYLLLLLLLHDSICIHRVIIGLLKFEWFDAYEEHEEGGIKLRAKYKRRAPVKVRRCRHSSFFYKGPQLYNLLPVQLRQVEEIDVPDQRHIDSFKVKLDKFLEHIPDEPTVAGRPRVAATNSLICQIPIYRRQRRMLQPQLQQ